LLANYIKSTDDKIIDLGQKSVSQRVAKLVLSMKNYFEMDEEGFVKIKIRREDMANMIGVATESLIRTLSDFQKNRWIQTKGRQLRIVNPKKLVSIESGLS
jgi:CRP/FNR family transcriptional regulator